MSGHSVGIIATPPASIRKLDAIGWGLFFIWIGIALLAQFSWGVTLFGTGVLIVAGQVARKLTAHRIERFWIIIGTFFVIAGAWLYLDVEIRLIPVLFILAGVALALSALLRKPAVG